MPTTQQTPFELKTFLKAGPSFFLVKFWEEGVGPKRHSKGVSADFPQLGV